MTERNDDDKGLIRDQIELGLAERRQKIDGLLDGSMERTRDYHSALAQHQKEYEYLAASLKKLDRGMIAES